MVGVIECDRTPVCYLERQDCIERACPNYQLLEIRVVPECVPFYQRYVHVPLQYCYCTNARTVERRITHIDYFLGRQRRQTIIKPLIEEPSYYYHNQMAGEKVIQCEPTPTPYCYWERQSWIEIKHPNYQLITVWSSINGGGQGFELRYCYCSKAKIVERMSTLGNKIANILRSDRFT